MPAHERSSVEAWGEKIEALWNAGARPRAIYDRLRLDVAGFDGSFSAIKRFCLRLKSIQGVSAVDVVIPVEVVLGEAQVDFGYVGHLFDEAKKCMRKAWVFVMTLAGSGRMVTRIVFDQTVATWLQLHIEAFEELGGVPTVILPDNLKAAVIRAAFGLGDSPSLNRSYREFARHYGFKIDPTPPRSPEKKGRVEVGVKYVKRNFFTTTSATQLEQAQVELARWTEQIANQRTHGRTQRAPIEVFAEAEAASLLPLPEKRFETIVWKPARVHPDCHISFDKRLYSVPWRFVGKDVWVRASAKTVEVYFEDTRIATHQRSYSKYRICDEKHLPNERRDLRHRSRSYWDERARDIGPHSDRRVVTGYFAYHAIPTNGHRLQAFRNEVTKAWLHALRRRSQRHRTTWSRMHSLAERWIPRPYILHPWPDERFDARTQGRSPVR